MMGGMHGGLYSGIGGLGWIGGLLGFLFFVGLVIVFVGVAVWLWRRGSLGHKPVSTANVSLAHTMLDERYARGELSREEYLQMREDLG